MEGGKVSNMKTIVLCGSMKVKDKILEVYETLKTEYNVLLPKECMEGLPKEIASKAHFNRIINEADAILVVNSTKNNIENYIGPNSFCEIAFAFHFNKKVFLLNDLYEPYLDELTGWHVTPLKGNLDYIKKFM